MPKKDKDKPKNTAALSAAFKAIGGGLVGAGQALTPGATTTSTTMTTTTTSPASQRSGGMSTTTLLLIAGLGVGAFLLARNQ